MDFNDDVPVMEDADLDLNDGAIVSKFGKDRVKHGGLTDITYSDKHPGDLKKYGNECSSDDRARLERSTNKTLKVLKHAIDNYDEAKFRKWFGKNNDKQTDEMVLKRLRKTYDFMHDGYGQDWDTICCNNNQGSCFACTGNVGAFVIGWDFGKGRK
jgi:hypothetical protein